MAAAVLARLLTAKFEHTLDLERQKHYSDVTEFTALLAVALEKDASRAPVASTAPGSRDEDRKRNRQRKDAAPKVVAPKDCKHPEYVLRRCTGCGEPEPQTCDRDYHLFEGGECVRCHKPQDTAPVKS